MKTPIQPALPADPDPGSKPAAGARTKPQPTPGPAATPTAPPDAGTGGGFTVLPSLQRVASGPVCENGVCYVPGAAPDPAPAKK